MTTWPMPFGRSGSAGVGAEIRDRMDGRDVEPGDRLHEGRSSCDNCYAERWRGVPSHPYEQGFDLKL